MDFGPILLNVCRRKSDLKLANSPPTRFNPIYLDYPNEPGGPDGFSYIDAEDLQEQLQQSQSQSDNLAASQGGNMKKLPLTKGKTGALTDNNYPTAIYDSARQLDHIYEEIGNVMMLPSTSVLEDSGNKDCAGDTEQKESKCLTEEHLLVSNRPPIGKPNSSPRKAVLNNFASTKDSYNSWSEGMTGVKTKSLRNVFVIQENPSGDETDPNVLKIHRGLTRVISPKKSVVEEPQQISGESSVAISDKSASTARSSSSPRQSSSSCDSGRPMSYASTASSNSSASSSCRASQVEGNLLVSLS